MFHDGHGAAVYLVFQAELMLGVGGGILFGGSSPPPLSPAEEAQEDQKCQSSGYQLNTPAYTFCRGELARQRAITENSPPVPSTIRVQR